MTLSVDWWKDTALMERVDLVDAYATVVEANQHLRDRLPGRPIIIAGDYNNIEIAASRMGLGPNDYVTIITNSDRSSIQKLRARKLNHRDIYAVPGWRYMGDDRIVEEIEAVLAANGIDWQNLAYAPSPEFERCESELDRYGRFYIEKAERLQRELDELRKKHEITETHESSKPYRAFDSFDLRW